MNVEFCEDNSGQCTENALFPKKIRGGGGGGGGGEGSPGSATALIH